MTLKMGNPSLGNDTPDIIPQQERSLALEQNTAGLGGLESKIAEALTANHVLERFPEESRGVIKDALIKACYLQCGANALIKDLDPNTKCDTF